jgi:hypothetical protein
LIRRRQGGALLRELADEFAISIAQVHRLCARVEFDDRA